MKQNSQEMCVHARVVVAWWGWDLDQNLKSSSRHTFSVMTSF